MIRIIGYLFGIGAVLFLIVAVFVASYVGRVAGDLPDYEVLASYEPPVTTRIHAGDGSLMSEHARERRLYLPIQAVPDRVKAAFLSAEDKNFYRHAGLDYKGLVRAVITNIENYQSGRRLVGASTITQQVAKNFLLSSERTIDRKIREAVLAFRIEQAYSKDRIFELYLNEIFYGLNSYGIASAALTYFNKSVNELNLQEAAYLAALPKGPSNYHPFRHTDAAISRRNWVIDRMVENGYVKQEDAAVAKEQPLGVNPRRYGSYLFASDYFAEEVRRQIIARYGEDALYEGGLSVRTTLDPRLQRIARRALHKGLIAYDIKRGYRGPFATVEVTDDWGTDVAAISPLYDLPEWRLAVVLESGDDEAIVGLRPNRSSSGVIDPARELATLSGADMEWAYRVRRDGATRKAKAVSEILSPGDVVYVEKTTLEDESTTHVLRQLPEVQGALAAMDPHTGRVLAMVGGFSYAQSQFNRATQALRQPGSAFKPFVYAAALDNGYSPASVVLDAPIQVVSGGELWQPKNYGGGSAGPSTLRLGIERSRNLMTVRLARDMGMELVAQYAERFGIYDDLSPLLAMSLGSGETTVLRMVSAYSVLANGGQQIKPSLIDRIQDRYGKTIYRHDSDLRICDACVATEWHNQEEPEVRDNREHVLDPMTAFQITSMLEGVVTRGTAAGKIDLGRPTAGKTGTTNEEKDAWFVGYTPDLVAGVFFGFDDPTPMGRGSTGGSLAAPIFNDFMSEALADSLPVDFRMPTGLTLVAINRKTGMEARPGEADVIYESFKPGTGPADFLSVIGDQYATGQQILNVSPQANRAIVSGTGGLY